MNWRDLSRYACSDWEVVTGDEMSTLIPKLPSPVRAPDVVPPKSSGEVKPVRPMKRAKVAVYLQMGGTALRELNNPSHKNFDPSFPQPFKLTSNGPHYFDASDIDVWLQDRKRKYQKVA